MRRLIVWMLALGLLTFMAGSGLAATGGLDSTANVQGTCAFNTNDTVAFGGLDPASSADKTATGHLKFWCTKNTAYTITNPTAVDGSFSGTLKGNGGGAGPSDTIPYTLTYTSTGTGSGRTTEITTNMNGTILYNNYKDASVGTYSDTVTFTVSP